MQVEIHVFRSFACATHGGNPAGVATLAHWLPDAALQWLASAAALPVTAFVVESDDSHEIRWFSPIAEIGVCGHASLAAAHLLFERGAMSSGRIALAGKDGVVHAMRDEQHRWIELPRWPLQRLEPGWCWDEACGARPTELFVTRDLVAVFDDEDTIRRLRPDPDWLLGLESHALIATSRGTDCDYVLRFFAPKIGIAEDIATGSAHCSIAPYWAARMQKNTLSARQLSAEGAEFECDVSGAAVSVSGRVLRDGSRVLVLPEESGCTAQRGPVQIAGRDQLPASVAGIPG